MFLLNDYSSWFASMGFSHPSSSAHLPPSIPPSILFVHPFKQPFMYSHLLTAGLHNVVSSFIHLTAQSFIVFNLSNR